MLFHYCSSQTFHSIITSGTLRLSSMTMSNDTAEGRWLIELLIEMCVENGISERHVATFRSELDELPLVQDGLGLCFSAVPDLLSQWRGYADDGHGLCLGFSETGISNWLDSFAEPIDLIKIEYRKDMARRTLEPYVRKIVEYAESGAFETTGVGSKKRFKQSFLDFQLWSIRLTDELYKFKNPAFKEEREWRLLAPFFASIKDQFEVQPTRSFLKPFRSLEFRKSRGSILRRVILGPKHQTPIEVVQAFVASQGYNRIRVSRSNSTYR